MASIRKQNGRHRRQAQDAVERINTKRILSVTTVALAAGGGLQMVNASASFADVTSSSDHSFHKDASLQKSGSPDALAPDPVPGRVGAGLTNPTWLESFTPEELVAAQNAQDATPDQYLLKLAKKQNINFGESEGDISNRGASKLARSIGIDRSHPSSWMKYFTPQEVKSLTANIADVKPSDYLLKVAVDRGYLGSGHSGETSSENGEIEVKPGAGSWDFPENLTLEDREYLLGNGVVDRESALKMARTWDFSGWMNPDDRFAKSSPQIFSYFNDLLSKAEPDNTGVETQPTSGESPVAEAPAGNAGSEKPDAGSRKLPENAPVPPARNTGERPHTEATSTDHTDAGWQAATKLAANTQTASSTGDPAATSGQTATVPSTADHAAAASGFQPGTQTDWKAMFGNGGGTGDVTSTAAVTAQQPSGNSNQQTQAHESAAHQGQQPTTNGSQPTSDQDQRLPQAASLPATNAGAQGSGRQTDWVGLFRDGGGAGDSVSSPVDQQKQQPLGDPGAQTDWNQPQTDWGQAAAPPDYSSGASRPA
ncbi:hypothetical protein AB0N62_44755 [Streptomyces sp. NPDC093982]|uniref:hypothetical protein n=1 Tax=Streptomyces sp. NPDC093982 TaxID=3155077 RepID=UPI0034187C27